MGREEAGGEEGKEVSWERWGWDGWGVGDGEGCKGGQEKGNLPRRMKENAMDAPRTASAGMACFMLVLAGIVRARRIG